MTEYNNKRNITLIIGCLIGNMLEFYDLILFGIFSPVIGPLFFPSESKFISTVLVFSSFALGFICRPLGSVYFGTIADKMGRKKSLCISLILMSTATGIIGLIPTYSQIGVIAPIIVILARCLQGFSAGGEYNSVAVFLVEHYYDKKNIIASVLTASGVIGSLLATWFLDITLKVNIKELWRGAFLFGACVGFIGLYIRVNLLESIQFVEIQKDNELLSNPLKDVWLTNKSELTTSLVIGAFNGIIYYFQFVYLTLHFTIYLNIELQDANYYTSIGLLSYFVFLILNGFVAEFVGTRRTVLFSCVCFSVLTPFIFFYVNTNTALIIICEILLAFMNASFCGLKHVILIDLFPVNKRCTGVSLGYSLGLTIFGGTTPLIMHTLSSYFCPFSGSLFISTAGVICFIIIFMDKGLKKNY